MRSIGAANSAGMSEYFGSTTAICTPRRASCVGSEPATSANPPVLTKGTHSDAAKSTRGCWLRRAGACCCFAWRFGCWCCCGCWSFDCCCSCCDCACCCSCFDCCFRARVRVRALPDGRVLRSKREVDGVISVLSFVQLHGLLSAHMHTASAKAKESAKTILQPALQPALQTTLQCNAAWRSINRA